MERWVVSKPASRSPGGVVVAQHVLAAEAGAAVLDAGGNAVDAAVTAGFVLQILEPWMSGLAACGYLLVAQPDGEASVVEFTGRTPHGLDPGDYPADREGRTTFLGMQAAQGMRNVRGWTAAVLPGAVRGLAAALDRFGTIGFDTALRPAIDAAERGLTVDWHTTLAIALAAVDLGRDPAASALFLPGAAPPEPGVILRFEALAGTLRQLAECGPDALYAGALTERLCAELQQGGSAIRAADLATYRPAVEPCRAADIAGVRLCVPGPSSGGQRLQDALGHFAAAPPPKLGPAFYRTMAEALREAFAGHERRLEPIEPTAMASTTHVGAADGEGRMAALTFTLLNRFGARVVSPSTGILMNNGLAWFDLRPGRQNSLRPDASGLNNMCPCAIVGADGPRVALGASGGNQIIPALAQIAAFMLHAGLLLEEAIHAPRIDIGAAGPVTVDMTMPEAVGAAMAGLGPVRRAARGVYPRPFASPSGVALEAGGFVGQADPTYPAADAVSASAMARPRRFA